MKYHRLSRWIIIVCLTNVPGLLIVSQSLPVPDDVLLALDMCGAFAWITPQKQCNEIPSELYDTPFLKVKEIEW